MIDGEDNEVVSREEAERLSEESGLDLVIVSLESSPPVVRLVDYGKYKFEAEKKAREAKKKQHVVDVKEVKMGVRIDQHDYDVKKERAKLFLEAGNKVKMTIRLRGREMQHTNLAFDLANRFIVDLQDYGAPDSPVRLEGRQIIVYIQPAKQQKSSGDKNNHAKDENPQIE
ncbi:MAG: translation initiation factor IF-3 [Vampirovibrio sp.]|nr:translation initiation factor IF-3 [Vampirovibrio sp.]